MARLELSPQCLLIMKPIRGSTEYCSTCRHMDKRQAAGTWTSDSMAVNVMATNSRKALQYAN
jgi:hypothetical protein